MAAQELKTFNDLAATDSLARVRAATLYLLLNRREDAKRVLREGLDKGNVESPSSRLLAALALADGNQEDAGRALAALPKETSDVDELVLRARYHLLRSETNAAVQDLRRALRVAPKLAPIHYEMALSDLQQANATFSRSSVDTLLKDALAHLGMASKLAPDYPEAVLQLAAIKTQLGAPLDAISDLDHFARANPRSTKAKLALGATLVGSGRFPEASEAFQDVLRSDPTSAEAHYWLGTLLLRDRKVADARREFETAASISPSYSEPTTQLVVLDLADGKPDVAFSRVTRQIDRAPQSARLFDLLGLVSEARNNASAAEAAYLRALRLDNNLVDAHLRLAEIYRASGKLDQSVAQADETVRLSPKNVNALMAAGASHQAKGDAAAAHQAYARVLQVDARNLGAANNLAVLLSEQSGGLDSAVVLARLAHELAPNDPHVSDTLGWIMYKRGAYAEAAPLLKSSASQLPDSPSIQYHLGMTAHQLGDTAVARLALTKAVASGSNFAGREDARRALAQLK
jgi:tetratricopeptide (TPR) repeat protein